MEKIEWKGGELWRDLEDTHYYKDYEFIAFNGRNERIEMVCATVFYDITKEMAQGIRMGIEIGLAQKYKGAYVRYKEI